MYRTSIIFNIRFNKDSFADFRLLYDSINNIYRSDKMILYILYLFVDKYNQISDSKIGIDVIKCLLFFSYIGI